jgi:hypothetical protein
MRVFIGVSVRSCMQVAVSITGSRKKKCCTHLVQHQAHTTIVLDTTSFGPCHHPQASYYDTQLPVRRELKRV